MITETREIYKCEHCRKLYQRKNACEKHEKGCGHNPDNWRACHECLELGKRNVEIYQADPNGTDTANRRVNILHCRKRCVYIYPPQVEAKKNWFDQEDINDGNTPNEPMPKECEFQSTYPATNNFPEWLL